MKEKENIPEQKVHKIVQELQGKLASYVKRGDGFFGRIAHGSTKIKTQLGLELQQDLEIFQSESPPKPTGELLKLLERYTTLAHFIEYIKFRELAFKRLNEIDKEKRLIEILVGSENTEGFYPILTFQDNDEMSSGLNNQVKVFNAARRRFSGGFPDHPVSNLYENLDKAIRTITSINAATNRGNDEEAATVYAAQGLLAIGALGCRII